MDAVPCFPQIEPYAGEFEKAATRAPRVPRELSESRQPPDPGSAHTNNIRTPQIRFIVPLRLSQAVKLPAQPTPAQ